MSDNCRRAAALGLFDGIHSGHRLVLNEVFSYENMEPAVFTFNTESISFKHGKPFDFIYANSFKLKILREMGFATIYSPDFSQLKDMDGDRFAREILLERMNVGAVVCGENFRFGKNVSCGTEELAFFGKKYGFDVKVVDLSGDRFSSEKMRAMLREGNTGRLHSHGCPYRLYAQICEGNKIGRTIDFPTINQNFADGQLVPKKGVYATRTVIGTEVFDSITNVGTKPTVGENIRPLAETHILGCCGNLYGRSAEVIFGDFIREEKKFLSVVELKKQIADDIEYVKKRIDFNVRD